ncbi:MAG: Holliday junction branch migration protein RuvA [Desulfovibrionaceae bacterium]
MIAYIEGRLMRVWGGSALVLTAGGVGYEVALPVHTMQGLPACGGQVCLYTSLAVREDALELFGFATWEERQTFEVLVGISRVGARTALAILGTFRPDELRRLVAEDNVEMLTKVSGIGKKTAQHIFLELKYRLKTEAEPQAEVLAGGAPGALFRDALDALGNLGYGEAEAAPVLRGLLREDPSLDVTGLLRGALKLMAKGK